MVKISDNEGRSWKIGEGNWREAIGEVRQNEEK